MISIIVPTYKEAGNIAVLSKSIHRVMNAAHMDYEIIIVDDDSNDGTVQIVDGLMEKYNITLKVRKTERGLSSAVIEGFRLAKGDIITVMDADLSHPPEKIPELATAIMKNGAEFALGSRFVPGGSNPHFNWFRKLNALISRLLARPLTAIHDPMSGFFAFPRRILPDLGQLNPIGFKIGLEVIVKASPRTVVEIPILFSERLHGTSKLSLKEQLNYIVHLKRLYEYKYRVPAEAIKFGMVGASGTIVDLMAVFISIELASLPFRIARIIGFMFGVTSNFLLNRRFTFEEGRNGRMFPQYIRFVAVSAAGFCVNWVVSVWLHESVPFFSNHYLAAAFMGILCGMTINFLGSKFLVFTGVSRKIQSAGEKGADKPSDSGSLASQERTSIP